MGPCAALLPPKHSLPGLVSVAYTYLAHRQYCKRGPVTFLPGSRISILFSLRNAAMKGTSASNEQEPHPAERKAPGNSLIQGAISVVNTELGHSTAQLIALVRL